MLNYTDDEIILGLRNRQRGVDKFICINYYEVIRHLIIKLGGNNDQAKDIFQAGMEDLICLIDKDEIKLTCSFKSFLIKICEYKWKNQINRINIEKRYLIRKLDEDEVEDYSENLDQNLVNEIIGGHINQLSDGCYEILKLSLNSYSIAEIAAKIGTTVNYIKKLKSLCKDKLISAIQRDPKFIELKQNKLKWQNTLNI